MISVTRNQPNRSALLKTINWQRVLESDWYYVSNLSFTDKLVKLLQVLWDWMVRQPTLGNRRLRPTNTVFFKSLPRRDYDKLFKSIARTCGREKQILSLSYSRRTSHIVLLQTVLRYWSLPFRLVRRNFIDWCFVTIRAFGYLEAYQLLKDLQCQNLVVFADMQPIESILVQQANQRGINTVTLQHGLYVDYAGYDNINVVNYKNASARHILVWGDDTRALMAKYQPSMNCVVCGKPLSAVKRQPRTYFTMLFDQNIFNEHNRQLLEISCRVARRIGMTLNLRFHPNNRASWFDIDETITIVGEDVYGSQFVVGHTTSMIFECMAHGVPSYRYKTDIPANPISEALTFTGADNLLLRLEEARLNNFDFSSYGKRYIAFTGDESLEQYALAFDAVLTR